MSDMNAVIVEGTNMVGKEYKIVDGPVTMRTLRALINEVLKDVSDDAILYTGRKTDYGFGQEIMNADYRAPIVVDVNTYDNDHQEVTFYRTIVNDIDDDDDDDYEDMVLGSGAYDDDDYDSVEVDYDESIDRDYGVHGKCYMSGHDIGDIMDDVDDALDGESVDYQLDVVNTVIDRLMTIKANLMTKAGATQQTENRDAKIEAGESM